MAEDPPQVPPVDAQPVGTGGRSDHEYRLLEADAKARENLNREADQRYWLRWVAVGLVVLIILGMGCLLAHVSHWFPTNSNAMPAVIALHIAPIVSMTTLAIALLVAAFRGFKEGDEKAGMAFAAESAKAGSRGLIN